MVCQPTAVQIKAVGCPWADFDQHYHNDLILSSKVIGFPQRATQLPAQAINVFSLPMILFYSTCAPVAIGLKQLHGQEMSHGSIAPRTKGKKVLVAVWTTCAV